MGKGMEVEDSECLRKLEPQKAISTKYTLAGNFFIKTFMLDITMQLDISDRLTS